MQTRCHLSVLIHEQAKKYGNREAITFRNFGSLKWNTVSWNQFSLRVKQVSNALLNLGAKPQENIAVFSQNCVQYLYTNFGVYGVRGVTIPFYATTSEQQIQYMVNDAQVRYIFVGEQDQYDKAHRIFALCPSLERIIIFDSSVRISTHDPNALYFDDFLALGEKLPRQTEVENLWKEASNDDICDILYTSGTTGESKGVVLTYGQYLAAMIANDECVPISEKDRVIDFLPFTHIFERGWAYLSLTEGAHLIINTYPNEIQQSMRETHPTSMSSVPRFWEKVYIAVKSKIDDASPFQRKLFKQALAIGRKRNVEYISHGRRVPLTLELKYQLVNKTILSLVRKQIGLDNSNIFPTAGAYVSPEVEEFVHSIGIHMLVGYGLTESLATVSCNHKGKPFTIGSVGYPIKGIEIKIGENSEVLLKGPTITRGYYHRDSINAEAFDADGFFHTGDAGYLKGGELFLKERIKDLFKTSNGKYIAPQMTESLLLVDKYIDQVAIIADQRKFVSALIVPEFRMIEEWAREHHIKFESREDLCASKEVYDMMKERIDTLQQQLAHYEQIKRFTLLAHHFSMESGELTNTLKLRRPIICKNYKDVIDKMFEE
ncbi:MAG: long-chain fatty acid--CoA ligase [Prevotella sp.]|jgi:long-chain acyl-CoA synthetase|nr:long-chain fatty acid--CoA ligase [Prevotella sp.]MBP7098517.1 long-chain fatty acid--CoA ligase [Prevotella sp.]MBP8686274.1 long-chain fatty acid--CoA ligase [Prevotella sp.]MBP8936297.1 long-chain fatty acid--CoA ligase [Prevotella sp.]MBP9983073.1 long-chain fatty acid--CoA ligase [Prevotella sp.]MCI1731806.1 long-chain fatty acid--CoA ligase [Prevotella sp.]